MPAKDLTRVAYSREFEEGAHNAVFTCLDVRPGERSVLITDEQALAIGAALADQFRAAGADLDIFVIEDVADRPLASLPEVIARALEGAGVSCFAAAGRPGELQSRIEMTSIVNRKKIRHAHMVNISPRIMCEGMRADFQKVDALCRYLLPLVKAARSFKATSRAGTDLTATFDSDVRWIKTSGISTPEKWGNLPGGEVFTAPARVDGVFVVDGVLGDWMAAKYGDMRQYPMRIEIEDSRIREVLCDNEHIVEDFRRYTSKDENSDRVGELALGTNYALREPIGQILQDEKIPGLHIAFGHPYSEHTGARWRSSSHIDVVGLHFDIDLDGVPLMKDSRFLVDVDALA